MPIAAALPEQTVIAEGPGLSRSSAASTLAAAPELPASQFYIVQDGDSVASIAANTGVKAGTLMALNAMRGPDYLYEGQPLRLFGAAPGPDPQGAAAMEPREDGAILTVARSRRPNPSRPRPYRHRAEGPQDRRARHRTGPGRSGGLLGRRRRQHPRRGRGDPRALRRLARDAGGPAARAEPPAGAHPLVLGRRIRLDFDTVPRAAFEQRRREYHARLQAAYFASHRIAGTQVYIVRRGDSLWSITQRDVTLPVWLLQQYNPDLDFNDLHPGTQISLPQVEDISGP